MQRIAERVATYCLQHVLRGMLWAYDRVDTWTKKRRERCEVAMSDPLWKRYHVSVTCPICKFEATRATPERIARPPEKDDASICVRCTSIVAYGDSNLVEVPEGLWEAWGPELHEHLAINAEAAAQTVREGEYAVDTLVWRGPDDWRAAITMANGLFVVSHPFAKKHHAESALKRARNECIVVLKWARGLDDVPSHWFGQVFLAVFNQEIPICPILGPFPTREVAVSLMQPQGVALAKELGLEVRGTLLIDKRTAEQKGPAN